MPPLFSNFDSRPSKDPLHFRSFPSLNDIRPVRRGLPSPSPRNPNPQTLQPPHFPRALLQLDATTIPGTPATVGSLRQMGLENVRPFNPPVRFP